MPKIKVKGQSVQTGERPQTNGRTHGCCQMYYRPCFAVDKKKILEVPEVVGNHAVSPEEGKQESTVGMICG